MHLTDSDDGNVYPAIFRIAQFTNLGWKENSAPVIVAIHTSTIDLKK